MARQPEPDLEFTEEELDQTTATRPASPMKSGKKSRGGRPLLWIFLLLLVYGQEAAVLDHSRIKQSAG